MFVGPPVSPPRSGSINSSAESIGASEFRSDMVCVVWWFYFSKSIVSLLVVGLFKMGREDHIHEFHVFATAQDKRWMSVPGFVVDCCDDFGDSQLL